MNESFKENQSRNRTSSLFYRKTSGNSIDLCHRKIHHLNQTINRMFDQKKQNFIELNNLKPIKKPIKRRSLSKQLDLSQQSIQPQPLFHIPTSTHTKYSAKQYTDTSQSKTLDSIQYFYEKYPTFPSYIHSDYLNKLVHLRAQTIYFLFLIHHKLQVQHHSFHLAFRIFDLTIYKFLQSLYTQVQDQQILLVMKQVAIASLYIALKYENCKMKLEVIINLLY